MHIVEAPATAAAPYDDEDPEILDAIELLGGRQVFARRFATLLDVHQEIANGFPAAALIALRMRLPSLQRDQDLRRLFELSAGTLKRKATLKSRLTVHQSDVAWRLAVMLRQARKVVGAGAADWLARPAFGVGWRRPIEFASTSAGAEMINTYLVQLEHGVYA